MTTLQKVIKYLALAFATFLVINIISAILFGVYTLSDVLGLTNKNKTQIETLSEDKKVESIQNRDVKGLTINLQASDLVIKKGDKLAAQTNNEDISFSQDETKLVIQEKEKNWINKKQKATLTLYIPENIEFEEVKIITGAGEVNIETLNTQNLLLEMGAGKLQIQNLNVTKQVKIDGGVGELDILNSTINNLDLDLGVGEVNMTTKLTGNSDIDSGVGELNINFADNIENYALKVSRGIGEIKLDGKEIKEDTQYGTGNSSVKLDGGIGSINITTVK